MQLALRHIGTCQGEACGVVIDGNTWCHRGECQQIATTPTADVCDLVDRGELVRAMLADALRAWLLSAVRVNQSLSPSGNFGGQEPCAGYFVECCSTLWGSMAPQYTHALQMLLRINEPC
jgi:hypothetical protein